ncbi:response regulator [Patescibacteria group bacterium]|nr:response regulator [Patescibacteria group bacterium]
MPRTLLHIDDDSLFRRALRRVFERSGWSVREAIHGKDGFVSAQDDPPEAILLDIRMPVQDGFETLRALKAHSETRNIPVIMCSSLGSKEDIQFCLNAGASGYLVKMHHQPEEMCAYVERLLISLTPTPSE